jgi:UDP-2-acetamido-3-amino-2,3-dideoxy-glucuronate N-acetyltransferase
MKKNIAVIGCGHWGKNLVRNFAELGALLAICDPDTELAEIYSQKYNVLNLPFDEILKDTNIKGIVLAVPAPLHASMAIKAMQAKKNVYVEKPLAMNEAEALDMISAAKDSNVKLMVGHLLQYHPVFIKVREIVESKKLGTLKYIYSNRLSFGKVRSEEDVIWSFAPHDISMILSLAGSIPNTVKTNSSKILQSNISDIATIHMNFKENLKAHISVSWLHPYKEQKLVVIGEEAMLIFDDTQSWSEKLSFYNHDIDLSQNPPILNKANIEYIKVNESEPLKNECMHFLDVVNNRQSPLTDGVEGLNVLRVLSAASLSEENNKVCEVASK